MGKIVDVLFVFVAIIMLSGCSGKEASVSYADLQEIQWDSLESGRIDMDSCVTFVKLETTDKCLVSDIKKIVVDDSLIFVMDDKEYVYEFDVNGNFIRQIGKKGHASSEYVQLLDFYLDKKSDAVYLYDVTKGIRKYDYEGNFISSISVETCYPCIRQVEFVDSTHILTCNAILSEYPFSYSLIDIYENECVNFLQQIIVSDVSVTTQPGFVSIKKGLFFCADMSDTIYTLRDNEVVPRYVLNTPGKHARKEYFSQFGDSEYFEAMRYAKENGFSRGIDCMLMTDEFIFLRKEIKDSVYFVLYDYETKKGIKWELTFDKDGFLWTRAVASSETSFVGWISSDDYLELMKETGVYDTLTEEERNSIFMGNPYVFFISPEK